MGTSGNIWMTSEGLDVDIAAASGQLSTEEILVIIEGIVGKFVSYDSKCNCLTFKIIIDPNIFSVLNRNIKTAQIKFTSETITIEWKQYNYKVTMATNEMFVSIQEAIDE